MSETMNGCSQEMINQVQEKKPVGITEPWPELLDSTFDNDEAEGYLPLPGNDVYAVLHKTAKIVDKIPSEIKEGMFGKLIISGKDLPGNSFLMTQKEGDKYWKVVDAKRKEDSFFVKKDKKGDIPRQYKIAVIERDEHDYA